MDKDVREAVAAIDGRLEKIEATVANYLADHTGWLLAMQAIAAVGMVRHMTGAENPREFLSTSRNHQPEMVRRHHRFDLPGGHHAEGNGGEDPHHGSREARPVLQWHFNKGVGPRTDGHLVRRLGPRLQIAYIRRLVGGVGSLKRTCLRIHGPAAGTGGNSMVLPSASTRQAFMCSSLASTKRRDSSSACS